MTGARLPKNAKQAAALKPLNPSEISGDWRWEQTVPYKVIRQTPDWTCIAATG